MIPLQIVLALIIFAIGWLWYDLQQTKKRIKKIEETKHLIMK